METIARYVITIFNDGLTDYSKSIHNVLLRNEKTLVYEDVSNEYRVVNVSKTSTFFGIYDSLDKPLVSEGKYYYGKEFDAKRGIRCYLYTHKDKNEALDLIKDSIIERFSWMNKENIEKAFETL